MKITGLKKARFRRLSVSAKTEMVEPNNKRISVSKQCELLHLPRSSYYVDTQQGESEENLELMRIIHKEYTRHPFLGARKLRDYLRRMGHKVNLKRVQRLMRIMGVKSVAPKPNTSVPSKKHQIYPYLLNGLDRRFCIFGGCDGLVQSQSSFLGGVNNHG